MKIRILILFFALIFLNTNAWADEFNEEVFCNYMKDFSQKVNSEGPVWVDHATRQDGVAVICNTKIVEYKKFMNVSSADLRVGWQERKQEQLNDIHCTDDSPFRQAIDNGWNIKMLLTFIDGKTARFTAYCNVP